MAEESKSSSVKHADKDTDEDSIEDLSPSELGTKEHWDKAYEDELNNFESNGVIGDIWFGEDIMLKIVRYIVRKPEITPQSRIVDLGCGNGALLLELAREDFKHLTGLDYSENALKMADALLKSEEFSANLKTFDLLIDHDEESLEKYDVCLDKGTFDAISLCPGITQTEARSQYFKNVVKLLKKDGRFILTSCNWTSKELVVFSTDYFSLLEEIPTPQFNFGGKSGNLVSIVVLKQKAL